MSRALLLACLALATALLAMPPQAGADVVFPKGRRVGLEPPPGTVLDQNYARFRSPDGKVSVTILEMPPPAFDGARKEMFAETAKPGVTVLKHEAFPFASGIGYLSALRVVVDGAAYRRTILLAVIPDLALLVSFELPESAMDAYPDELVQKTLASTTVRPPPIEERLELLPFTISDLAGFAITDVLPGRVLLGDPDRLGDLPRLFVSVGVGAPDGADARERLALDLMRNAPLPNIRIVSNEAMRIRGARGYEVKATAKDPSGAEVDVIQWVRFGGGSAYLMVFAAANKDDWDRVYPRFRALRDGVEPRR